MEKKIIKLCSEIKVQAVKGADLWLRVSESLDNFLEYMLARSEALEEFEAEKSQGYVLRFSNPENGVSAIYRFDDGSKYSVSLTYDLDDDDKR